MIRFDGKPGHDEPHELGGSMNTWQDSMRQRAGKDTVCIWYHAMMSINPGVFPNICSLLLGPSPFCISIYIYLGKAR